MRENKKISIVIKNVIWFEKTLMHKAVRPSNYFFQFFHINQAEQIKEVVICIQILLEDKESSNLCPNFVRNTPY